MSTKEIQAAIGKRQALRNHIVCENISPLFKWEMDVMSVSQSGRMYEFEVKISKSDFKADAKKRKDYFYSEKTIVKQWAPNFFSYACPAGMLTINDIPPFAGLYYFENGEITEVRAPRLLHNSTHDKQFIINKAIRLMVDRQYIGCARLTYNNRLNRQLNLGSE